MRIGYHFLANLHIALLHKKRARKRKWEVNLSKPRRFDVFPSQNSACIRVILEEQLCHWHPWECTDARVQGKPKVNEYLGSRKIPCWLKKEHILAIDQLFYRVLPWNFKLSILIASEVLSHAIYQFHIVRWRDNLCPTKICGRLSDWLRLTGSSRVQPCLRERSAGSFPEQRLVIEPNGLPELCEIKPTFGLICESATKNKKTSKLWFELSLSSNCHKCSFEQKFYVIKALVYLSNSTTSKLLSFNLVNFKAKATMTSQSPSWKQSFFVLQSHAKREQTKQLLFLEAVFIQRKYLNSFTRYFSQPSESLPNDDMLSQRLTSEAV